MKEIALQKQELPPRIDAKEEHYKKRNKVFSFFVSLFLTLTIIFTTSYIVVFSLFSPVYIQGQSMDPTLNDFPVANNIEYREFGLMNTNKKTLNRGDVAIFDISPNLTGNYIVKRIIGLPNETIKIYDGGTNPDYIEITTENSTFVLEEDYLKESAHYAIYSGQYATNTALTLGENQYFALGDNRGASQDSRNIGPLNSAQLKGKLIVIYGYYLDTTSYEGGVSQVTTKKYYYPPWKVRFF